MCGGGTSGGSVLCRALQPCGVQTDIFTLFYVEQNEKVCVSIHSSWLSENTPDVVWVHPPLPQWLCIEWDSIVQWKSCNRRVLYAESHTQYYDMSAVRQVYFGKLILIVPYALLVKTVTHINLSPAVVEKNDHMMLCLIWLCLPFIAKIQLSSKKKNCMCVHQCWVW